MEMSESSPPEFSPASSTRRPRILTAHINVLEVAGPRKVLSHSSHLVGGRPGLIRADSASVTADGSGGPLSVRREHPLQLVVLPLPSGSSHAAGGRDIVNNMSSTINLMSLICFVFIEKVMCACVDFYSVVTFVCYTGCSPAS